MSQGGLVALAIIAAAVVIGGVILGIYLHGRHEGQAAAAKVEKVFEDVEGDLRKAQAEVEVIGREAERELSRLSPGGSGRRYTMGHFERLRTGMSYRQAAETMGEEGTILSREALPMSEVVWDAKRGQRVTLNRDLVTIIYGWTNADGSSIAAAFQDDRLITKSRYGL
jgi:hypothetical protein